MCGLLKGYEQLNGEEGTLLLGLVSPQSFMRSEDRVLRGERGGADVEAGKVWALCGWRGADEGPVLNPVEEHIQLVGSVQAFISLIPLSLEPCDRLHSKLHTPLTLFYRRFVLQLSPICLLDLLQPHFQLPLHAPQ